MLAVNAPTFRGFCPWLLAVALLFCATVRGWGTAGGAERAGHRTSRRRVLVLYSTGREAVISITRANVTCHGRSTRVSAGDWTFTRSTWMPDDSPTRSTKPPFVIFFDGNTAAAGSTRSSRCWTLRSSSSRAYRDELFPGYPVIFFALKISMRPSRTPPASCLRWISAQTVRLATALQPEINHVFVVSGAAARDRAVQSEAANSSGGFRPDWRSHTCRACRRRRSRAQARGAA